MPEIRFRLIRIALILLVVVGIFFGLTILATGNKNSATKNIPSTPMGEITVNNVTMKLINAHTEAGGYRVEVCYTLPDQRDWLLTYPNLPSETVLTIADLEVDPTEEGTMYWKYDQGGVVIQRCQYLFFAVFPSSRTSILNLRIGKLYARKPAQSDYCLEISETMGEKGYEISIDCMEVAGLEGFVYVKFPVRLLSMDPFFRNIFRDVKWDFHKGPWIFTFPLNPN